MKHVRKAAFCLYIAAVIVVLAMGASIISDFFASKAPSFAHWLTQSMPGRVLCAIALGIVAVHALAVLVGMALDKPEPARMRLEACPDIEVSVDALRSVARAAATSADVMVEDVRARVVGRNKDGVEIKVDAIALTSKDLKGLAHRVQSRVQAACDDMLGVSGVRVQVCFLPSKTTTVTKEVMR